MKKNRSFSKKTVVLLAASAVLLLSSAVGSTRAALTYYSENYSAEVTVSSIGVTLVENGEDISYRDYLHKDDQWSEATGTLLTNMIPEGEKFTLGKTYQEEISVKNSGVIDSYVRVILTKSWKDADGVKDTTLTPELIGLGLVTDNGWVIDEAASTTERTVLYYTDILKAGESTPAMTDTLRIDPAVGTKVLKTVTTEENGYQTITYVYEYDGYTFTIDAEVDAVQTHNAQDAIKSAWGVDVTVGADGSISLR